MKSGQDKVIHRLYETVPGRWMLTLLVRPSVSRLAGWCLDRRASRLLIRPFVRISGIDLSDYPRRRYRSFNDFFTRTILPGKRPVDISPETLPAPCDAKLTAWILNVLSHLSGIVLLCRPDRWRCCSVMIN